MALFGQVSGGVPIPGLLSEVTRGSIFLDEFDKVEEGDARSFYSALLRPLEQEIYNLVNSTQEAKAEDINWVFAGAFDEQASLRVPKDFWSRLTHKKALANPLPEPGYISALFLYFFFREAIQFLPGGLSDLFSKERTLRSDIIRRWLYQDRGPAQEETEGFLNKGKPGTGISNLANEFENWFRPWGANGTSPNGKDLVSIRLLRQAIRSACIVLWEHTLTDNIHFTWEGVDEEAIPAIRAAVGEVVSGSQQ